MFKKGNVRLNLQYTFKNNCNKKLTVSSLILKTDFIFKQSYQKIFPLNPAFPIIEK